MLPQFISDSVSNVTARNVAIGCTIFILGHGKKVLLADSLGNVADPVFDAAARGDTLTFVEAWGGALAYTFQIYFDFSATRVIMHEENTSTSRESGKIRSS